MTFLNLGILAHVDAGKTSLTERLLYMNGVVEDLGRVDDGTTQTDSMELEQQRGITIKTAVASFSYGDITVNLIDTPGHSDFIAEVERALSVLDGAVLVVSAVEGVQAQTRVLMRTLDRLGIPTLLFINKVDRTGASTERTFSAIRTMIGPVVAMTSATDEGQRSASVQARGLDDPELVEQMVEVLADNDEGLLEAYVDEDVDVDGREVLDILARQTADGLVHPVYCGSAITGVGTNFLMDGIATLLRPSEASADGPLSAMVFKVDRGPSGAKIAFVRMFSGILRIRDRLQVRDEELRVTSLSVYDGGTEEVRDRAVAGQITKVWGLQGIKIGDVIGERTDRMARRHFSPPTLETVVDPVDPSERVPLYAALDQLAEQDPLINLRQDDEHQEVFVSLYGEVQKEVIADTLEREFGIVVTFRESTTICIERPNRSGEAFETLKKPPNPFLATVGLRVEPGPLDSGVRFELEVELGSMPIAFFRAVEASVEETLRQGLYGWLVTDLIIYMTHRGYLARQSSAHGSFDRRMSSTAADFRNLTPLVLMDALKRASTSVYHPILGFHMELPADCLGAMLPVLARMHAIPDQPVVEGTRCSIDGEVPAEHLYELQRQLPSLTRGEGVLESSFDRYDLVVGTVPERARPTYHAANRKEYLNNIGLSQAERARIE